MIGQKFQKKINNIYAYVEAMQRVENILKPLWDEYINEQDMTRKKRIWAKIEKFEQISNNLNDRYLQKSCKGFKGSGRTR